MSWWVILLIWLYFYPVIFVILLKTVGNVSYVVYNGYFMMWLFFKSYDLTVCVNSPEDIRSNHPNLMVIFLSFMPSKSCGFWYAIFFLLIVNGAQIEFHFNLVSVISFFYSNVNHKTLKIYLNLWVCMMSPKNYTTDTKLIWLQALIARVMDPWVASGS